MHIVYLIKFNRDKIPNMYIGSKSNCTVDGNKIIDKNGNLYMGSSKVKEFVELVTSGVGYELFVLGEYHSFSEALSAEREAHIANDVVASPKFFNRIKANESNYSNPEFATYKHVSTGKVARLERNHPSVLSGEWVGVTKGNQQVLSEEQRLRKSSFGEKNGFYGKKHSKETLDFISKNNSEKLKGKLKSDEHKRKLSEAAKRRWETYRRNKELGKKESL